MIPYFRNPNTLRVAIQAHTAHERRALCNALTSLQLQANGDVRVCATHPPVGNIKSLPIRRIWEERSRLWEEGCCLYQRCSSEEKERLALVQVSPTEQ
jgi:MoaA/NifB/PqqE/SkfB family radical SAM enzyme